MRMPRARPRLRPLELLLIFRAILRGGYVDKTKLPDDFITELRGSARSTGYAKVSRGIFRSLKGFDRARERYPRVSAPVTLVYSKNDWSRPAERDRVALALADVHRITAPRTGHFSALERPDTMARILLDAASN
ncbi:alpha/beta fold hydrolase [Amycolatopsis sp. NPDC101161]|uniref:alpha/beta fold hydrolase n=1 Tax=Amycolatopsis sp. NPDC101161 TaxID=3363940 RepID=UPI00382EF7BB